MDRRKWKKKLRKKFGYKAELVEVDIKITFEDYTNYLCEEIIEELNEKQPSQHEWASKTITHFRGCEFIQKFYFSKEDADTAMWFKLTYG
ncbi:hypothetical protein [Acetobacter orientalis]|uniref:hypothetical protein n=1 Tax=Acetobacter orientalis TaxID=146474 RepID=UPI0039ED7818